MCFKFIVLWTCVSFLRIHNYVNCFHPTDTENEMKHENHAEIQVFPNKNLGNNLRLLKDNHGRLKVNEMNIKALRLGNEYKQESLKK